MRLLASILLSTAALIPALAVPSAAQVSRPPCRDVLSQVNKEVNAHDGRPASALAVAKKLGTEPEWVRRCMAAYGRVPSQRSRMSDSDREAFERAVEEGRPIEVDEDNEHLRYDRLQEQRLERQELRARQKKLREEREFDQSSMGFDFPMAEY
jgi:hypothetical protein